MGLDAAERAHARKWWSQLGAAARAEFRRLWDSRADDTALSAEVQDDGSVVWNPVPIEIRGLIVEGRRDMRPARRRGWDGQQYEYLLEHPEAMVFIVGRRFHVCRAHPAARRVLQLGRLRCGFACPLEKSACPMMRILDATGGRTVEFAASTSR